MTAFPFEREKFWELILYIAHRCEGDDGFGDTHLNKTLFFSDAFALQYLGRPITGARYQKLPQGPAARALLPVRQEMVDRGEVKVRMEGKTRITSGLRKPDPTVFREEELKLVDAVIELLRGKTAHTVSVESHLNSPGWNLVEIGEDVPLESQMISTNDIALSTLERGRELSARFGW